ncbi:hypothetical protein HVA01_13160 [Halovibrio variabilis]|uniref:Uncharacterized protein n=1 Tax=Halovibrio variabilis TaxID=31910 RepID=A0A511UM76_9GAMM|nr:hypothetical protein [Halovibrio variabilis]GEN27670.1 hypothetical protein HVA01_13160 [Halovibrio variabilis]
MQGVMAGVSFGMLELGDAGFLLFPVRGKFCLVLKAALLDRDLLGEITLKMVAGVVLAVGLMS